MGLFEDLKRRGLWRGYTQHVLRLEPILVAMSERGIPVDAYRHSRITKTVTTLVDTAFKRMQANVPDEVRAIHPKLGYKKVPKDFVEGGSTTYNGNLAKWTMRHFPVGDETGDPEGPPIVLYEQRAVKLLAWKPSGGEDRVTDEGRTLKAGGLIRYIKWRMEQDKVAGRVTKYFIPRDFRTDKATTGERELTRLYAKTKDPLLKAVRDFRDAQTLQGHVENWTPCSPANELHISLEEGPNRHHHCSKGVVGCCGGRVHSTFYYDTATGQLGSRRPNVQNAPKHKKGQANLFRWMIKAPVGRTLLEFDYKSFHAITFGFEAQDPDWIRLARQDIHSFLTAFIVGEAKIEDAPRLLALPDADLFTYLKGIRAKHDKIRARKAKEAVYLYVNGGGARNLYEKNKEHIKTQREAKEIMDTLARLFPKTVAYLERIRKQAHQDGYLLSRHGSIRYFWEVFKYDRERGWIHGNDSETATSFFTQNDAHGELKDAMNRLDDLGALALYYLVNQIHDALLFDCPDSLVPEALRVCPEEMERPSAVLVDPVIGPFWCGVAASTSGSGGSWNAMREVTR